MEKHLQTLHDRQEISDLLVDYCRHLDRMDLDALGTLFSKDCVVVYGPDPRLNANGRDALITSLGRMWRWQRTAHHLSNIRIWFDGTDKAHCESYVHAWHEAQDRQTATVFGRYLDRLERRAGVWLIVERRMQMNGADAGFRVAIPRAPRNPPPPGWSIPTGMDD